MAHPLRSVIRAALGGLVLGLLGAAALLAVGAFRNAHVVCQFPGTQECSFELSTAQGVARLQAAAAVGCALVGAGLALALRRP